jgi:hypothetical protein
VDSCEIRGVLLRPNDSLDMLLNCMALTFLHVETELQSVSDVFVHRRT